MRQRILFFSLLFLVFATTYLTSCYNDNEQTLYGTNTTVCDTTAATFTAVISPIFKNNCATAGCHTASAYQNSGGINLDGYANIQAFIKRDDGVDLFGTTTYAAGHSPMPKDAAKLPDCTVNKLRAWYNRGYLNN